MWAISPIGPKGDLRPSRTPCVSDNVWLENVKMGRKGNSACEGTPGTYCFKMKAFSFTSTSNLYLPVWIHQPASPGKYPDL